MKYLKTYKLWESSKSNENELYRDLIDILYIDIFDEFGVVAMSDESFDDDDDDAPKNKFWCYRLEKKSTTHKWNTSNFEEIGGEEIDSIIIYNISEDEKSDFNNILLNDIKERVKSQLNKELVIGDEPAFVDDYNCYVYDYILKLKDLPEKNNESVNWSPEEIINELTWGLKDAGLQVNVYSGKYIKHRRVSANHPRFEGEFHVEITDNNRVVCKNYPEDDMDWLYNKPIIMDFFDELTDFGLIRDKDYKVYGGGTSVNLVFQKEGFDKVKL